MDKNLFIKKVQKKQTVIKLKIDQKAEPKYEDYFFDRSPVYIINLETNVIVMGASVGGPRTFESILKEIPRNFPSPILIVQHMNNMFTRQFTIRLNQVCSLKAILGKNGDEIKSGIIYVAQGDKHMQIIEKNEKPHIRIYEGAPVNFCRPSVDVLFYSAARIYKEHTLGILLTGMGTDGVNGLKSIKEYGGRTISESQETDVLYGMPKMAVQSGVSDYIVPSYKIKEFMINYAKKL